METYIASQEKENMLNHIADLLQETCHLTGVGTLSLRVLDAFKKVPREQFVPKNIRQYAYSDRALSIGNGQTISQPFIVAFMTESLDIKPEDKILEIGTGSGYQTAILSHLAKEVYTIDVFPSLVKKANKIFQQRNYHNISTKIGNGYEGWKEHAPYNKIIITACCKNIPPDLIKQLALGGKMILPLEGKDKNQRLTILNKDEKGEIFIQSFFVVFFVPLL